MFSALPMYNMFHQEDKNQKAPGKIFRPWDVTSAAMDDQEQDSTISTTSTTSSSPNSPLIKTEPKEQKPEEDLVKTPSSFGLPPSSSSLDSIYDYAAQATLPYLPLPPQEFIPGLHSDLLMSQNYALEEYARILTQDHQAKLLSSRKQRPKKYKCPHCNVGFSNNGQLKGHIRIHTGERPFKCDDPNCGKTFTRNEELTRHKRIHSGLRPFSCSQCGKRFGRKDHLKKHSRTHMQPRNGLYAVPVMFPLDTWASAGYPYMGQMGQVPMLY